MDSKDMPRIAIATCHDKINYGSFLQAYATQAIIERLGFNAVIINKFKLKGEIAKGRRKYYLRNLLNIDMFKSKLGLVAYRARRVFDKEFGSKISIRDKCFRDFSDQYFNLSEPIDSFAALGDYCECFDAVLVGSDQNWLPVNIAGNYYTLSYVLPGTKKISYSTSFGVSSLSREYEEKLASFLEDFEYVSVRENSGAEIIKRACNRSVPVVCDPTMLLSASDWRKLSAPPTTAPDAPYILCYFLGSNRWNRECVNALSEKHGLKKVFVYHPDEYVPFDNDYADYQPFDVGPREFLYLISNATYVFTDSFHATVFSCLFEKQFFSFRRHQNVGVQSTNTRLDNLVELLSVQDRLCDNEEQFDLVCERKIDYQAVNARIDEFRDYSLGYLKTALGI